MSDLPIVNPTTECVSLMISLFSQHFCNSEFLIVRRLISRSWPSTNLSNVAAELKKNSEAKVHIVGYADANTGSPELNLKLSEARAKAVQEVLKKYGVAENQMIVEWVGDTVQPYEDNDMNRVVLFVTK